MSRVSSWLHSSLASDGVCRAAIFSNRAGGLLHHRFNLTCPLPALRATFSQKEKEKRQAVYFLLHFPSASRLQNNRVIALWFIGCPAVSWHLALRCPDFPHTSLDCSRFMRDRAPFQVQSVSDLSRECPVQVCKPKHLSHKSRANCQCHKFQRRSRIFCRRSDEE